MQATRRCGLVASAWLTAVLAFGLTAFAQPGVPAVPPADGKPATNEKTIERLIYLPFKNLKAVFEKPDAASSSRMPII